ncbi:MAG TPA: hypothetical protein VIN59_06265 [Alphaproteobacteria bacterium]
MRLICETDDAYVDMSMAMRAQGVTATWPDREKLRAILLSALFAKTPDQVNRHVGMLQQDDQRLVRTLKTTTDQVLDDEQETHLTFALQRDGMEIGLKGNVYLYPLGENLFAPVVVEPWHSTMEEFFKEGEFAEKKFLSGTFLGAGMSMGQGSEYTRTIRMAPGLVQRSLDGTLSYVTSSLPTMYSELRQNVLQSMGMMVQEIDRDYALSAFEEKATDGMLDAKGTFYLSLDTQHLKTGLNRHFANRMGGTVEAKPAFA